MLDKNINLPNNTFTYSWKGMPTDKDIEHINSINGVKCAVRKGFGITITIDNCTDITSINYKIRQYEKIKKIF